ncbi:MAG: hypothetical protein K6C68_06050 [Ruminococcus sp.]|nr:hypothetical protein [Ruminococcus sp.]
MKKRNILVAAVIAVSMLAVTGCGSLEDVEPEKDGANLLETTAPEETAPDEEDGNDEQAQQTDPVEETDVQETTDSEITGELSEDSEAAEESIADEESSDTEGGEEDDTPAEGEGDSYYNKEFGMTVPLPGVLKWQEYSAELMPDFEDSASLFRPLMETENVDDCVLTIMEYSSDSTLDDFTKAAWDRDYRNAGESEDKYEVIDTQVLDFGGRQGQLITERLTSPNGEFYYGTIYISYDSGDYIKFRITCLTEEQLNGFTTAISGTTFD